MRVLPALALGLLLLSATLDGPEARPAQPDPADVVDDRLQLINRTYHQRLESTYKYQQAIMPMGYRSIKRYLQLGNKKYLFEYALDDRKTGQQLREDYALRFINHDTVRVGTAHYVASDKTTATSTGQSVQSSISSYSERYNGLFFNANNLAISQNFDPLAVLSLRPNTARSRQWLYAWSMQPAQGGDTVASYHLFRSRTGDTCRLQLRECSAEQQLRRHAHREPWRSAQRVACSWQVELTRRRLTAEQVLPGEGGGILRWVRTYRTATDFTETLTGQYRIGDGGPPHTVAHAYYSRDFTQINPSRSVDTFTVFDEPTDFNELSNFDSPSVTKPVLTFSIVSTYR